MGKKIVAAAVGLVVIVLMGVVYFLTPKIRVVRMGEVLEVYSGRVEATKKLEEFTQSQQGHLDSLKKQYQKVYFQFQSDTTNKLLRTSLMNMQYSINEQETDFQQKYQELDQRLSGGVLTQVNQYLETYCKEEGIDILLGHFTGEGVLYSLPRWDITEDLLTYLDKKYAGKKE